MNCPSSAKSLCNHDIKHDSIYSIKGGRERPGFKPARKELGPHWQLKMLCNMGNPATKRRRKMNYRESLFKKLAGLPENLKITNCSALP